MTTTKNNNDHGIQKKSDYEHIRLRTGMYLGSQDPHTQSVLIQNAEGKWVVEETTWVPALFTAFREILDNASDEVLGHGYGNRIDITYDEAKLEFSVEDNGRGIPFDFDTTHNQYLATMVLTEPRAGRNFGERGEVVGTNGIGASAVSITSEWFSVVVNRDGKKFQQTFLEGKKESDGLNIQEPKITPKNTTGSTGTKISYHPSNIVYKNRQLSDAFMKSRVTEFALSNPNIKIYYNGTAIKGKPKFEQTMFPDHKPVFMHIEEENFSSKFWIVPDFVPGSEHVHSTVNNIPTFNGGVQVETFRRFFVSGLITALERESKKRKLIPNRSDIMDGVLLYNITKMKAPNFDSQSKTRLINEDVEKIVKKALDDPEFFKTVIKKNSEWIDSIYERCAERTMKKDAADANKLAKKLLRSKVAGLMDASGKDRSKCILLLAEGNSAISSFSSVRDPEIHGGLGLKGKVMNVHSASIKQVLEDEALQDIMNSIGLIPGQKAVREQLRYWTVYIGHDMDPDGLNIGALLINFFYKFWPELFQDTSDPFIQIFMTPFIIAEKGKVRKYWYSDDHHLFDSETYKGWSITRAKGLGTLTEEDWKNSIDNPKLFPITADANMTETLSLVFDGTRANDRKVWIGI